MAYVPVYALRRIALRHTQFAQATCGTTGLKLFKIGALVRISVRITLRDSEVTIKRGLASPPVHSALATTRRARLKLSSVDHIRSLNRRRLVPFAALRARGPPPLREGLLRPATWRTTSRNDQILVAARSRKHAGQSLSLRCARLSIGKPLILRQTVFATRFSQNQDPTHLLGLAEASQRDGIMPAPPVHCSFSHSLGHDHLAATNCRLQPCFQLDV
jgi:hypothetical protein